MRFENEGMLLWHGLPDSPVSGAAISPNVEVTFTLGVEPADASNRVEIRYRVSQGSQETAVAQPIQHRSNAQYFIARLPAFRAGDTVEYSAVCRCAGKQVPAPDMEWQFASTFQVVEPGTLLPSVATLTAPALPINDRVSTDNPPAIAPAATSILRTPPALNVSPPGLGGSSANPNGNGAGTSSIAPASDAPPSGPFVIKGQVRSKNGTAQAGMTVRAFDRDLRHEESLGTTTTN